MNMIDTVVYFNGEPKYLIYTGKDGFIRITRTNLEN